MLCCESCDFDLLKFKGQSFGASAPANGGGSGQPKQRVRARRGQATDPHSIAERVRFSFSVRKNVFGIGSVISSVRLIPCNDILFYTYIFQRKCDRPSVADTILFSFLLN